MLCDLKRDGRTGKDLITEIGLGRDSSKKIGSPVSGSKLDPRLILLVKVTNSMPNLKNELIQSPSRSLSRFDSTVGTRPIGALYHTDRSLTG